MSYPPPDQPGGYPPAGPPPGEQPYGYQQQPGGPPPGYQQPGGPPPGYQQPGSYLPPGVYGAPQGAGPGQTGNGLAVAALVLGILSLPAGFFLIGGLFGILAIIFGIVGVRRARTGAPRRGLAIGGIVTGALGLLLSVAVVAIGVSFFNSHKGQLTGYANCLNQAGNDQAAQQSCAQQYLGGTSDTTAP